MALPSGKIITAELTFDADKQEWSGYVRFEPKLMPMDLHDGLEALAGLSRMIRNTAKNMIREGNDLAELGITGESIEKAKGGTPN